jgi:hypothetical protein
MEVTRTEKRVVPVLEATIPYYANRTRVRVEEVPDKSDLMFFQVTTSMHEVYFNLARADLAELGRQLTAFAEDQS